MGKGSTDQEIGQVISLNLIGSRDRGTGRQERQKKYDEATATAAAAGGQPNNATNEDLTPSSAELYQESTNI